jgi:hypothetical protein
MRKTKSRRAEGYHYPFFTVFSVYVDILPHEGVTSVNCERIFHSIHINYKECTVCISKARVDISNRVTSI